MKGLLIFPPGWCMYVGSPHLGLPLLQAVAGSTGIDIQIRDLNLEIAEHFRLTPTLADLWSASDRGDLESLNNPYFDLEDKFDAIARPYRGSWNVQLGFRYAALGADSSADVLEAASISSPFREFYIRHVVPDIEKLSPEFIGISIAAPGQLIPAFQLCKILRDAGYAGLIIMGGNIISRLKDDLDHRDLYRLVNIFVCYQGEAAIVGIIAALKQRDREFQKIPNVVFFDGKHVVNSAVVDNIDLQQLPPPNFDGFPLGRYWGENYVTLVAARGCYYGRCHFCAIPLGWNSRGFAGARKDNLVFRDMLHVYEKYGVTRFKFIDEAMITKTMIALATEIEARKLPFEWEAYVRLENVWSNPKFISALARGGFRKAYFGLELLPSENRDLLNKRDTKSPEVIIDLCHDHGIKVHLFCLFGYPGTGRSEAENTIEFVLNHAPKIDTLDIFRFGYMRGTKVPGARPIVRPEKDWALEYDWLPDAPDLLTLHEAEDLKADLEEIMWSEHPKMLHPTYRMLSPWRRDNPSLRNLTSRRFAEHDA